MHVFQGWFFKCIISKNAFFTKRTLFTPWSMLIFPLPNEKLSWRPGGHSQAPCRSPRATARLSLPRILKCLNKTFLASAFTVSPCSRLHFAEALATWRLVLGCIEAYFCNQILIFQFFENFNKFHQISSNFSRSTRFSHCNSTCSIDFTKFHQISSNFSRSTRFFTL